MKIIMAGIFGGVVGLIISIISPYHFYNWQWWAALMPIVIIGVIYATIERKGK